MSRPYLLLNVTVPLTVGLLVVALGLAVIPRRRRSLRVASVLCGVLGLLLGAASFLLGLTIP